MLPLCRWPFPRLCGFSRMRFAGYCSASNRILSSSFSFLSITQLDLADQPQSTSPSLGLLFPTAQIRTDDSLAAGLPARYVPPSGFGYPLDGLLPSIPSRFFFAPAALVGFTLRSFLLLKSFPALCHRNKPAYCFSCHWSSRVSEMPAQQTAVPGFVPSKSPWR